MSYNIHPDLLRKINEALAQGGHTHTLDDIAAGLVMREYVAFEGPSSLLVCSLSRLPRSLTAHAFLAAGHLDELVALYPQFEAWAREEGADRLVLIGRPGWERIGKRFGWGVTGIEMTKSLLPEEAH